MPIYEIQWQDALDVYCRIMRVPDAIPYILNENAIRSAIARPYQGFGGVQAHPTLHEKAAALLSGVAKAHGFADGNKRTAVLITLVFIRASGYSLDPVAEQKLDDVVVELITGERDEKSVAFWFKIVIGRVGEFDT